MTLSLQKSIIAAMGICLLSMASFNSNAQSLKLNDLEYLEDTGVNILVYSNTYNGGFCDEKLAGIEIIQRGERIATGGGIRFMNTPEQWDIYADMLSRSVNREGNYIEADFRYEDYDFNYKIRVTPQGKGALMQVFLDKPVPSNLIGKAGMNLEFFPASYFGKNYLMDGAAGILPKYPQHNTEVHPISEKIPQYFGESTFDDRGRGEFLVPLALATGKQITLAPEDDDLCVSIKSDQDLSLFDGRLLAQNGTFVVRALLPSGKTGKVLEWYVEPKSNPNWIRKPNIGFSQVGYTPAQQKVAVVELDKNDKIPATADIIRVMPDGSRQVALKAPVKEWGVFNNRYNYAQIDFSSVKEEGLYMIDYAGTQTNAFPINKNVYNDKWHATMDIALVVNMDHIEVNEAYRVWHGRANMDDALQAPLNVRLHDGYTQGDVTNTKYQPLEHIPNIAIGGWYDAGDFDNQSNTTQNTAQDLITLWRTFRPERDMTYIDEKTLFADIHRPDGIPDVVQYVMHGTLNVNALIENIGFVPQVVGQPNMHQYHHLGDAMTLTDGLIYDPSLKPYEVSADGRRSGTYDDRLVFTARFSPAGTMSTAALLASAYTVLKDYFPEEAERSLKNAIMLWDKYASELDPKTNPMPQNQGMMGRMGGGSRDPRMNAAIELYYATGDDKYKDIFLPIILEQIDPKSIEQGASWGGAMVTYMNLTPVLRVYDLLDKKAKAKVDAAIPAYIESLKKVGSDNPYSVPITGSGWGGNNQVMSTAYNAYLIWKKFPDMVDPELVFRGLNYLYGCHPYSNVSFITAVGVNTKKVAYGNNRADYTVIPGGVVPGLLVKNPDFMENKDDYPFLWGENECCINSAPNYIMLNLACIELAEYINK